MNEILLLGGGGHSKSAIDVIESHGGFSISGILEKPDFEGNNVLGYPIVGNDQNLTHFLKGSGNILITIGQVKSPNARINAFERARMAGAEFPIIVSPNAYISRFSEIMKGTIIMHNAVVSANTKIGENCIINSMALIEHDVIIGSHCHISTGARINGGVVVAEGCFVGSGAVIANGIKIGKHAVIGAGSVVLNNVPAFSLLKNRIV